MTRTIALLAAFALAAITPVVHGDETLMSVHAGEAPMSERSLAQRIADFERAFGEAVLQERIPGAAYAVVAGGRIMTIGGHGRTDLNGGRPVDAETVFRLASVSKGFAGTLAVLLAREGGFTFEEPITRYRPDFRFQGPHEIITVRDLLSQTTGFIPNAYDNLIEVGKTLDEIIPHFQSIAPLCAPGTCYTYQNGTFSLIQPVLETAGQAPYEVLLARRLFEPLDMRNASVGYEPFIAADNRAEPHVRAPLRQWRRASVSPNYYRVAPAAGVNASALDMAHWMIALLGHRDDVLPEEVVAQVTAPAIRTRSALNQSHWRGYLTDAHYGLGWRVYRFGQEPLIHHGGWVAGYRADISLSRGRDVGLVILANAESSLVSELTVAFWAAVINDRPIELRR